MRWKHKTWDDVGRWHRWFAWYPVDGSNGFTYWWIWVERRLVPLGWESDWEYRPEGGG